MPLRLWDLKLFICDFSHLAHPVYGLMGLESLSLSLTLQDFNQISPLCVASLFFLLNILEGICGLSLNKGLNILNTRLEFTPFWVLNKGMQIYNWSKVSLEHTLPHRESRKERILLSLLYRP